MLGTYQVGFRSTVRGLLVSAVLISALAAAKAQQCEISITAPDKGAKVGATGTVEGKAKVPPKGHLWVLSHRRGLADWWPQGGAEAVVADDGSWEVTVYYGQARDVGSSFEVAAVVVGDTDNGQLKKWVAEAPDKGYPGRGFPNAYEGCLVKKVAVQKTSHD